MVFSAFFHVVFSFSFALVFVGLIGATFASEDDELGGHEEDGRGYGCVIVASDSTLCTGATAIDSCWNSTALAVRSVID